GGIQVMGLVVLGLPCLAALAWIVRALTLGHGNIGPLLGVVGLALGTSAVLFYRIVRFLSSPSVVVGTDGIAIQQGRWRQYIPYRQVAALQKYPLGVRLRTREGRQILLPTWTSASGARSRPEAPAGARRA